MAIWFPAFQPQLNASGYLPGWFLHCYRPFQNPGFHQHNLTELALAGTSCLIPRLSLKSTPRWQTAANTLGSFKVASEPGLSDSQVPTPRAQPMQKSKVAAEWMEWGFPTPRSRADISPNPGFFALIFGAQRVLGVNAQFSSVKSESYVAWREVWWVSAR